METHGAAASFELGSVDNYRLPDTAKGGRKGQCSVLPRITWPAEALAMSRIRRSKTCRADPILLQTRVSELPIFVRRHKNQSVSFLLFTTNHKAPETETAPGPASPIPP
ncbi:hypothetical protein GGI35DRAFT_16397 [Trichoderma velutinum]